MTDEKKPGEEAQESRFQRAAPGKQPAAPTKKSPEDLSKQIRDAGFEDVTSPGKGMGFVGTDRPVKPE